MPARLEMLKQAGFSDAEIAEWATTERQRMQDKGFTDNEIDDEFGVTRPPREVPDAFVERLMQGNWFHRILGAAAGYAQHYYGDEPLGFSPENTEALRKLGGVGDLIIRDAKPVDAVLRSVPAGIAGLGAGFGQALEEGYEAAVGPTRYNKGKAARDFAQLAEIAALVAGTNGPKPSAMRAPAGRVTSAPVIELPRAEDFRNAAATISGTPANFGTEQKLLRLWTEHGIPPTEVAQDAMRDPAITEAIRSDSAKLPDVYVGTNAAAAPGARSSAPAQLAESAEADRATVPVESNVGAVEADDTSSAGMNSAESAPVTAEARRAAMKRPPRAPQRPFDEDYPGYPVRYRDGQLVYDIEGRPLDANFIVGRRVSGGADQPLSPEEMKGAMKQLDMRLIDVPLNNPEVRKEMPKGFRAAYLGDPQENGPPRARIYVATKARDRDIVIAHEFAHAIDHFTGMLLSSSLTPEEISELRAVYGAVKSQPRNGPKAQPEHFGYGGKDINRELAAEGLRAYMADPNYFKTVAPKTAAKIRDLVNENPYLKDALQFNSLGAIGLIGAGVAGQDRDDR